MNSSVATALHAAFISGMIPLLAGKDAFYILKSYASIVVGGRLSHIHVTMSRNDSATPSEIVSSKNTNKESFISSLGLTSLFSEASQNPDNMYLVVLDGINQALFEECLAPLLHCYDNRWKQGNASIPDNSYSLNRTNKKPIGLFWPKNVLLAGIFVETSNNAKIPQLFWDHMVFIDLSLSLFKGYLSGLPLQNSSVSTVPAKIWQRWCEENQRISATMQRKNWNLVILDLSGHSTYLCQRVSFALLQIIIDINLIDLYLLVLIWLPIAISSNQTDKIIKMIQKPQWNSSLFSLAELAKMKSLIQGRE
ncbi:hypothetical protein [Dictyobacter kobayashii]|uniref:hypothetical protein n=1 Tax=Dictyobacter kobayashii TaxID=2014872 RepID=UPI000F8195FD|nr:hypothetical protein [Dictyobacter kobayashii]